MRREMTAGVEVVYTKDSDADMFITAEAKAQRAAGAPRVVVVSGDTEIGASLDYRAAMGWMTAEMYMLEMKRVSRLAPNPPPGPLCASIAASCKKDSPYSQDGCIG